VDKEKETEGQKKEKLYRPRKIIWIIVLSRMPNQILIQEENEYPNRVKFDFYTW
jgi:hypothetical protein